MDYLLIAGLWLQNEVWDNVASELERLGHRPTSLRLPGVDDAATDATLADQLDAVTAAIDSSHQPIVVGHSAACTLAWLAADRRTERVSSVVLIGGFPAADGEMYADFFPVVDGAMAFPGWEPFEGADSADLDHAKRALIADQTVPVPEGVARGVVRLADEGRFDVPVAVVCPEFSADQARAWIDGGDVPDLGLARNVSFADIDSGHWPMVTQPAGLARILADVAAS